MPGLLEALFDAGRKPKTLSERSSLTSLPSLVDYVRAGQAKQATVCGQKFSDSPQSRWPPESLDAERRFGQPHSRLFPFLGRKVRTPEGPGTLLQVFAERVTVLLDSQLSRSSVFHPREIEPASPE